MNEKTTSLSPGDSQNFREHHEDEGDYVDIINRQALAEAEKLLPKVGEPIPLMKILLGQNTKKRKRKTEKLISGKSGLTMLNLSETQISEILWFEPNGPLARRMPKGRRFIIDLLHKIWDLIDEGREGIEENFNQTALTQCYSFNVNTCMKEDHTTRHVAEWAL